MFLQVSVLTLADEILQDAVVKHDPAHARMRRFCKLLAEKLFAVIKKNDLVRISISPIHFINNAMA